MRQGEAGQGFYFPSDHKQVFEARLGVARLGLAVLGEAGHGFISQTTKQVFEASHGTARSGVARRGEAGFFILDIPLTDVERQRLCRIK